MKSNTGLDKSTTPIEDYKVFFEKEHKQIFKPVFVAFLAVILTTLLLNLVAFGFGYKTATSKKSNEYSCSQMKMRYYVKPGYLLGCWFGNE
jgi:hypothetical protein